MAGQLPRVPYGAVYFRKSNPPRDDWARDYRTAADDGMNTFRHWFLWSAIETAPGVFDWDDYDRQLDLAAEHGLTTIIAEMIALAPEWAWRRFEHARYEDREGRKARSLMHNSCAVGGAPGLCLDNEDVRERAEGFLRALVERYREHSGLGGYDVWNECNIPAAYCYCPATAEKFRAWLRTRYGDLPSLGRAWRRYGYAEGLDIQPPRQLTPYPDVLDWLQFRIDNAYRLMRWRVELIRSLDQAHPVTAHGVALTLSNMADTACHEWRAAAEVDTYGFTWVASRRGNEPWKQWHAVDLVRAGSRGTPFWHAEAQAGPLWMQPQVIGRPREDGRIAEPEDVRLWNLVSFAGGATGLLYPRMRPLLDGPLFGAFGAYGMNGARTERSEMASGLARWVTAPGQADLWAARPVQGEVGIVVVPESQLFCYAQHGSTDLYAESARGAYQGFFDNGIQPDWVSIDDVDEYTALYLPFPQMLPASAVETLRAWVERGGTLISEGCPGYFGDGGHVGASQPNNGLDALFGACEAHVEFTPDILGDLTFEVGGRPVPGGIALQVYEATTGAAAGRYVGVSIGRPGLDQVAVVDHAAGEGRTRLIGTFPGYGHFHRASADSRAFYADLARWAGIEPHVHVSPSEAIASDPAIAIEPGSRFQEWPVGIVARLHASPEATFLWLVNHRREPVDVAFDLSSKRRPFVTGRLRRGDGPFTVNGRHVTARIAGRDAAIVQLR